MTLKQAINIIEPNDQQALDNDLSETQNLKTHLLAYLKNHMKNGKIWCIISTCLCASPFAH